MPTFNPRVNVTLSPSLDVLVSRLAAHQHSSKSQVLRELLEAAEPALQRAVALMDVAASASDEVKSGLARSLEKAQDRAEDAMHVVFGRLDQASALATETQAVKGRRATRRTEGGPPGRPKAGGVPGASKVLETPVPLTGGSGHRTEGPGRRVSSAKKRS